MSQKIQFLRTFPRSKIAISLGSLAWTWRSSMAKRRNSNPDRGTTIPGDMESSMDAGDQNSGGGNASGSPDADTGMSVGDRVIRGNPRQDRKKLFPDRYGTK